MRLPPRLGRVLRRRRVAVLPIVLAGVLSRPTESGPVAAFGLGRISEPGRTPELRVSVPKPPLCFEVRHQAGRPQSSSKREAGPTPFRHGTLPMHGAPDCPGGEARAASPDR
eukprot:5845123-Alexandrium_andersonii.AAC.2